MMQNTKVILIAFIAIFPSLVLSNFSQNLIGDEAVYIVEGDRYLHTPYSFYNNSGSPHVLKTLSAVFFYSLPLNRDYSPYFEETNTNVYKAANFTYNQNLSYSQTIITLARIPHLFIALALGFAIYLFTKKHFDKTTALIALIFYAFNANILANSATSNLDIGTTAFTFFTLAALYTYFITPQDKATKWLIITALLLGITQTTKISGILLYPFIILVTVAFKHTNRFKQIAVMFLLSFLAIWALYGFQVGPIIMPNDKPDGLEAIYGSIPLIKDFKPQITDTLRLPIYPAGAFFNNFTYQFTHSLYGHTIYFNGQFTDQGLWYLIPLDFVYKNSAILLAAIGLAVYMITTNKLYSRPLISYLIMWTMLMLLYSIASKLQLGIRYFFPAFPTIFILAAVGLTEFNRTYLQPKLQSYSLVAICALYILSNLSVYPAFFTYRSELIRNQNPVNLLSDSDYDWGQSVHKVGEAQKKLNLYPLFFKGYGGANHEYYGIQNSDTLENAFQHKQSGYYAISHSSLVGYKRDKAEIFEYFTSRTPDHIIDQVIYVYKINFN